MKRIALITMARNDNFFLERWIAYYGPQIGYENIFIYLDGIDSDVPKDTSGKVNIIPCEKIPGPMGNWEPKRMVLMSQRAGQCFKNGYDMVIGCDSDEFIVVDPDLNMTLAEYLSQVKIGLTISPFGLDVGQKLGEEMDFDYTKGFLEQRHYAIIAPDYTKPSIVTSEPEWGSGFHRIRGHNYHIDKNLYTFHLGCFDEKFMIDKMGKVEERPAGWEAHFKFRHKAIETITSKKALDWDSIIPKAKIIEKWFRPPFLLNRPSMLNMELVVRIPEKFQGVV